MRFCALVAAVMMALTVCGCKGQEEETKQAPSEAAPPSETAIESPQAAEEENPVDAARKLGTPTENEAVRMESGLTYIDVKVGDGAEAKAAQVVSVHYTGWLVNGTQFDSSVSRGKPFEFPLGGGRVIKGWDLGVAGMKLGGVRKLIIPPELGYGETGTPGGPIPPNATLIFEVELLEVE